MKIIEEPWKDYYGNETVALSLDKEGQYTISEFIELLQAAKDKFGDKKILIHDINDEILGGFRYIYLNYDRDLYGNDTICICA